MRLGRGEGLLWLVVWLLRFLPVWASTLESLTLASSRLNVGDTLTSPSGHFELGIFPYPAGSGSYYLCVRYAAPIEQVVVWMANRENSVSEQSYLELSNPSGDLQLSDPNNDVTQIPWSSNTANVGVGSVQLLDKGNLVLADDAGNPLWESFKNSSATDTLLPGQYFYRAANKTLTSWLTKDDPTTGNGTYTFGWGIRTNESILQLAWTSPKEFMNWTGGPYIPAPDVQSPPTIPNVDFVYFDATLGNLYFPSLPADTVILSGGDSPSATTLKRVTLDTDGGLRIWQWTLGVSTAWTPEANWVVTERGSQCYTFGTCGPFGWCNMTPFGSVDRVQCTCPYGFEPVDATDSTRGCTPRVALSDLDSCNASMVNFTVLEGTDMPWGGDHRNITGAASANCEEACLKDCSCAGASYSQTEQYCWLKMAPLYNLGWPTVKLHGDDRTAFIKISLYQPPLPDPGSGHEKASLGVILGATFGALGAAGLVLGGIIIKRRCCGCLPPGPSDPQRRCCGCLPPGPSDPQRRCCGCLPPEPSDSDIPPYPEDI